VPTLYVDHHRPTGMPGEATVVTGYGCDPIPNSAWMAHELFRPLVPADAHAATDWVAAVGTLSDLGDKAPWPPLAGVKKRFTAKWLKEAVVLCNAARRAPAFDVATALRILLTAEHPRAFGDPAVEGTERLAGYRKQVNAAVNQARRRAPTFSEGQPVALIELDSPCQVHPLIAQQWSGRLPDYAVIAANRGYLPGVVAFSSRTKIDGFSLPEMYRTVDLGADLNAKFGNGHDQASGGHLPPDAFEQLLRGLGFDR
jgi:single-stranded-DNA-specific exonuclease